MSDATNPMRKVWIGIAIAGAVLATINFSLDWSAYPSDQAAERILRRAVGDGWEAFRLDGTPDAPQDVSSISSVDCRKDEHIKSDFPLFACVYRFKSVSPLRDYIGVVGALYWRDSNLSTVDGYVPYAWAIPDQRAILEARGIRFPIAASP